MKTRIAIAEDNAFLLQSIKDKLAFFEDLEVRFTAANGAEMIGKIEENSDIDVILMDIQMPEMDGIKATEIIKNRFPQIKIIMLTVMDDDQYIFNSIIQGANGYLLKEIPAQDLYRSIHEIMEGGAPMSPTIALRALKMLRNPLPKNTQNEEEISLTKRETEILESLSKGLEYKQIADNLFIASGTVRKHVENIYRKLNVRNKMEAVQKAMKSGIL